MNKKRKIQRLLAAVLVGIMTVISVNVIPASAEENPAEDKKKVLFSSDFENAGSSFTEDGWTKVTAYKWYSGGDWEYPDWTLKANYNNQKVLKFAPSLWADKVRAVKTISTENIKELVVEFDAISPNGQTVQFGLTDYIAQSTGGYLSNTGQTVSMWSGIPEEWTRVKVVFTFDTTGILYDVYTKSTADAGAEYEAVSGATGRVQSNYASGNVLNLCIFATAMQQNTAAYFDNVEVYEIVRDSGSIVYENENLFMTDFENKSSSFTQDGWTKVTAYKWYSGGDWEYPDWTIKGSYDNQNVLKFAPSLWADKIRAVKTISTENMKELVVEFDAISPNGQTVQFGLTDYIAQSTGGYLSNTGQTVSMWSGTPEEWTRVKVVFTFDTAGASYAVYTKSTADAGAEYEAVSGATGKVPENYASGNVLNLCIFATAMPQSTVAYFDNFSVYTIHAYKNGKCIECGKYRDGIAALEGYSLTLAEGTIGLNFYMEMNPEMEDVSKTEMRFTVNGRTQTVAYADAKNDDSGNYRVFTCEVYAKQMADEITAVMYNNGAAGNIYTYSVKQYADKLLADEAAYAKEIPLVQAMLNYGAYAQEYFRYNTENPANGGTYLGDKTLNTVTADLLAAYVGNIATGNDRVKLTSASLVLDAQTSLRLYLSIADDVTVEGLKQSRYGSYVERKGILPQDLTEDVTVSVSYGEQSVDITYNCMAYCHNVLKSSGATEELKNVVRALYLYSQSAAAYAGE